MCSSSSTFVRYVLQAGLDSNAGLELDEPPRGQQRGRVSSASSTSSSDLHDFFNPLERVYKPRILRIIPDAAEEWSNFNPDALCRLLLPGGLRFCTHREVSETPAKCHPFVVTREDGQKWTGVAVVFYEEVHDTNICHALHTLQKMHSTTSEGGGTLRRSSDRMLHPQSVSKVTSERSRSLPRHYHHQQGLTRLSSSTLDLSSASYDYRKDTLYASKAVALVCSEPLVDAATKVLKSLYRYSAKSDFDLQVLEVAINNLLHDVPIPSPGRSVRFSCRLGDDDLTLTLSIPKTPRELPVFDYDLLQFFDLLGVENAIKLIVCMLLEHQVLVYSSDVDKLMLVCESATTLMYPFSWPHVYVPILPPNMENFLDAPVPYIMGLLRRTHDIELAKRGSVCILDIDNMELSLPEELPDFPYESELIEELGTNIVRFGGKEGADILREHAIEMESMSDQNNSSVLDSSDTMEQLNLMISQFESLSKSKLSLSKAAAPSSHTESRLRVNNALREVFVNRFVHMFVSFEYFVIQVPGQTGTDDLPDPDAAPFATPQQQETLQNFDKTSFLSDQKHAHWPFLSSFLETQAFSVFVDDFLQRVEENRESAFGSRLAAVKKSFSDSLVRTPTYEPCTRIDDTDEILRRRMDKIELTITPQKPRSVRGGPGESFSRGGSNSAQKKHSTRGIFPLLDPEKFRSKGRTDNAVFVKGDRKSRLLDHSLSLTGANAFVGSVGGGPASLLNPSVGDAHWKSKLLNECRSKTKRILLEKLGKEAVEWGHGDVEFSGSEENMLVASMCDLLERIWSHGLQNRQCKSSLWHFLYKYGRANERAQRFKGALGTQAYISQMVRGSRPFMLAEGARPVVVSVDANKRMAGGFFDSTLLASVHNVSTIHEIKTDIGYGRAWVRLALERRCLSQFLSTLLSDPVLLKNLYKPKSFLLSDEEREQALFHLQTLGTVEFSCFTNAYTKSSLLYQAIIFPSSKSGTAPCSANCFLQLVGSLGESEVLQLPRGTIHFAFWSRNLGVLTSLRLGHDNSGSNPNWLVEHVLVRNEFTGHMFKFACGRWLGTSVDDGSCERYLVGYQVGGGQASNNESSSPKDSNSMAQVISSCTRSPARPMPPPSNRGIKTVTDSEEEVVVELQTMLGDAINRIIKLYHKSLNEKISYAHLMCGELGLVHVLMNIFSFGYKSARLFGKNLSVWDFFLKVTMDFNQGMANLSNNTSASNSPMGSPVKRASATLEHPRRNSSMSNLLDSPRRLRPGEGHVGGPQGSLSRENQFRRMYTKLITRIETTCPRLGKDDKFQLFVCLAAHDTLLGRIVTDLTRAVAAQQLYEDHSFLRKPALSSFLSHVLAALKDISVPVDPAMTKTLEQHFR